MKLSFTTFCIASGVFLISLLLININSIDSSVSVTKADPFKKRNREDKPNGPEKVLRREFLMTRDPHLNIIPYERLSVAKRRIEVLNASSALRTEGEQQTTSLSWSERGPNNIGGRTRAVLVDKSDATGNTVFAGSVGGGLWRTTNFKSSTPTWKAINDFFANIAISSIKQSPTNPSIMYFGTGEGWGNSDAIRGLGIWKSTDGGLSWNQLTATQSIEYVLDLEFDNNGYIYAATRTTNTGLRGIIRSADGGTTWNQVLTDPSGVTTRGADLERAPNGDMYATLGIFATGKIFRAPENGANTGVSGSWVNITPPDLTTNGYQRTELTVAPNSSRIYAVTQHPTSYAVAAMYRSDDFGVNWTKLADANWCDQGSTTTTDFARGQAWYDLIMAVNPGNGDHIFAAGIVGVKSTNAGGAWTQMTRWTSAATCNTSPVIHADIHEIQFLNSNEMIVGTDGGIYYSADGGGTFTAKNQGYNVTQYYAAAIDPTLGSNKMIGGSQDNGSHLFSSFGINSVSSLSGGDGAYCFIDQSAPSVWVTSSQYSNYYIFRSNGTYVASISNGQKGRFINPAEYDDVNNVLYYGDVAGFYGRGFNIETGTVSSNNIDLSSIMGTSRQVSSIKVDPSEPTTIWLACSNAETNSGASVAPVLIKVIRANGPATGSPTSIPSATLFNGPSLPNGAYISSIDVDAGNSNHLLLTVSNYGVASVWESTDGGSNWTSLDNNGVNLPDMPIRYGIFLPAGYNIGPGETTNGIMLATELGVWTTLATNGTSTSWDINNAGLANVRVDMVKLRKSDKTILAATHGRGIFTTVVSTVLPVKLTNFDGKINNNEAVLHWSTASESRIRHFEVQESANGVDYTTLGTVKASGNSNILRNYSFTDYQLTSSNYYRLKIVEEDGNSSMSKVVLLKRNIDAPQNLVVLNNPFTNQINLKLERDAKMVQLQLFNLSGALIAEKHLSNTGKVVQWIPNTTTVGTYILRVFVDGKVFSKKVVKN